MRKMLVFTFLSVIAISLACCNETMANFPEMTDFLDSESQQIDHILDGSNTEEMTAAPDSDLETESSIQGEESSDPPELQTTETDYIATENSTTNDGHNGESADFVRMEIYQYGEMDSVWGQASYHAELDLNDKKIHDNEAEAQIKQTIGNKEYNLQYDRTIESYFYESKIDYYITEENGEKSEIGVDRETGKCVWFAGGNIPKSGCETADGRYQVAYEFFAQIVDNPDHYQLTSALHVGAESSFRFMRVVSGLATNDYVSVFVSEYGIEMFKLCNVGYLKDAPDIGGQLKEQVCQNVNYRIINMFKNMDDGYSYNQNVSIDRLVKTETGRYALQCSAKITATNPEGQIINTSASYLVYLDDNYDYEETTVVD